MDVVMKWLLRPVRPEPTYWGLWNCGSKNSAYCVSRRVTELQFMDTEKTVNHTLLRTVLFSVKMKLVLSEAPERLIFSSIFVVDL